MDALFVASFLFRLVALAWAVILWLRSRRRRLLALVGLLSLLVLEGAFPLLGDTQLGDTRLAIPSLVIGLATMATIFLLGDLLEEGSRGQAMADNLRAVEEKFVKTFHSSADAVTLSTLADGRFVEVNAGFTEITGYDAAETLNRTSAELELWVDPKHRERLTQTLEEHGRVTAMDTTFRHKDGRLIHCQVSADVIDLEGEPHLLFVVRDLTWQKGVQDKHAQFVAELETQGAQMERFTYSLAHELRSPLVTIRGFLGLLAKDVESGDRARIHRDLERIQAATEVMQESLDQLLDLASIGRSSETLDDVELCALAAEARERIEGLLERHGATITIDGPLQRVRGDRHRLVEIYGQLFDNALKFSVDGVDPVIHVGRRFDGDQAVLFVRDNGIGIERRFHRKVFDLFERLDPHSDGVGIGLALVKRVVEVHGGRVWIESLGPDMGTTVCFTLPPSESFEALRD